MFKNYFKTAFRNLWNNKGVSLINITGLVVGLTSCLLISLYIRSELNFDKFEKNGDRIVRVIMQYSFDGSSASNEGNYTSVRVAYIFPKTFPEVKSAVKMTEYNRVVTYNEKLFVENKFMYADSSFFKIFSFRLLRGDPNKVIDKPYDVVLTKSTAEKYFGNEDPVGKTLKVGNDSNLYRITGIMQDCPANSQIQLDLLASFSSLSITPDYEERYWDANYTTYLLLRNKNDISELQSKLPAFMKKEMAGQGATVNFFLEPFEKIHLYSPYDSFVPNNSIAYIYILAAVALLILIIACFTFINLNTARSLERAKEVGVRKVLGAMKGQLFRQFISESALVCIISLMISVASADLLLPFFNHLTGKQIQVSDLFYFPFVLYSILIALCISLIAGVYPALVLTAFQPVKVLKGSFKNTASGQLLRKSLTIFQFVISVFLIISTMVIQRQLFFIQHKKLGYNREHVLVLPMDNKMLSRLDMIKQEFKTDPDILSVARCVRTPVEGGGGYNMRSAVMPADKQMDVTANPVDEDYVNTVGLQLEAGSNFTHQDIEEVEADSGRLYHFILNESAARELGWTPKDAVGKKMFLDNSRPGYVTGVVKDFNFESLRSPIKPFVLFPEIRAGRLLIKLDGHHVQQTISFLASKWKELVPDRPFEYHFLDEDYDHLYQSEIQLGKVMNLFASIGILLACFGLFGLSSYAIKQRTKEIGIRKVLGANVTGITALLAKDFISLVFIAFIIAAPVAWLAASRWLLDYAYRIKLSWTIFFYTGLLAVLIALITVSFQAIRTALMNPVKSLRTE
jgi:putative ABC transport system permease protein